MYIIYISIFLNRSKQDQYWSESHSAQRIPLFLHLVLVHIFICYMMSHIIPMICETPQIWYFWWLKRVFQHHFFTSVHGKLSIVSAWFMVNYDENSPIYHKCCHHCSRMFTFFLLDSHRFSMVFSPFLHQRFRCFLPSGPGRSPGWAWPGSPAAALRRWREGLGPGATWPWAPGSTRSPPGTASSPADPWNPGRILQQCWWEDANVLQTWWITSWWMVVNVVKNMWLSSYPFMGIWDSNHLRMWRI